MFLETLLAQGRGSGTILKILSGPMWSGLDKEQVGKTELVRILFAVHTS